MEKSRLQTKVGLFVVLGLALLATLLILFSKSTSPFSRTYELRLHASNVGGLKPRTGVLLAGVQVGSVSSIQLAGDGKSVTILLDIYQGCKIYRDARFIIEQSGFLGDQYVSIIPTSNAPPVLVNGDEVNCQEPFNLQEVARSASGFIKRIDETAKKLDDSASDLRRIVLNEQTLTNFSATMHNMRTISEQALGTVNDINALVATNSSQINLAVSNVVFFSQELLRLANSAEGVLATNSTGITAAVKNIESSTEVLKDLLNNVQSGKGLAGTMLENEQLTTNVQAIANNLAIASSNLNRLGLWHFLWHKEPVRLPPDRTTATNTPTKP
jgi:phospholipid/cholesterol/gamma-HCH transport system substrate-binding protein